MHPHRLPSALVILAAVAAGACRSPEAPAPAARRVEIVAPREGETLQGPDVTVRLAAHDFLVVRAGDATPNSGHHHVFLDRDVSPAGAPIPPNEPGRLVHLGNGASEVVLQGVAPGRHRLIAVVGDAGHVPLDPPLHDTVHFTVR